MYTGKKLNLLSFFFWAPKVKFLTPPLVSPMENTNMRNQAQEYCYSNPSLLYKIQPSSTVNTQNPPQTLIMTTQCH